MTPKTTCLSPCRRARSPSFFWTEDRGSTPKVWTVQRPSRTPYLMATSRWRDSFSRMGLKSIQSAYTVARRFTWPRGEMTLSWGGYGSSAVRIRAWNATVALSRHARKRSAPCSSSPPGCQIRFACPVTFRSRCTDTRRARQRAGRAANVRAPGAQNGISDSTIHWP